MLRQVHVDQRSVSESASVRSLSRASFYQAQTAFEQDGLFGLLPLKRGPRGGHELNSKEMEFVFQQRKRLGCRVMRLTKCRLASFPRFKFKSDD